MSRDEVEHLETIHLRLARMGTDELAELIRDVLRAGEEEGVRVFHHTRIGTDLLVVVHPRAEASDFVAASELGLRLVSLLRDHGIVDHSVWRPVVGNGPDRGRR